MKLLLHIRQLDPRSQFYLHDDGYVTYFGGYTYCGKNVKGLLVTNRENATCDECILLKFSEEGEV